MLGLLAIPPKFSIAIRETASQLFQPERVFRVITSVITNFVWVLIVLVVTYYLLMDWERLREWFIGLFPKPYKTDVRRMHDEIIVIWRRYFRGQLLVMLMVGILSGLSGSLIGLPKAAILGLLTGMLDMIPSLGPIIATMLAAVVAWHKGSAFLPTVFRNSNLSFYYEGREFLAAGCMSSNAPYHSCA